jgi:hypothetical protein
MPNGECRNRATLSTADYADGTDFFLNPSELIRG